MLLRRIVRAFGALALGALAGPALAAEPWQPNPDDALLFDVRLNQYRLGDGVRGYATPTGPCIDFGDTIMALGIPVRLDKQSRRATGWAFEEGRTIEIDRVAGREQIMNKQRQVARDDIRDTPEGWCVNVAAMERWLGVSLVADQLNALLHVKANRKLPPELAAERRARIAAVPVTFDLAALPKASAPWRGVKAPAIDVVAATTVVHDRVSGKRVDATYEVYAAGEAGPVAYDARLSSNRDGTPASLRLRAYRTDPAGKLPLGATHVAVGDVQGYATALVAQTGVGRGAVITNRPIDRPQQFDRTDFRGALPRGWDAELYRNGQLLGFVNDRADGRYEFLDVPLQYGQNRFEIVLYGPQGQVRREVRSIPVGLDSIPPRKTFWWAGIDEEGRDLIGLRTAPGVVRRGWRGTLALERGLDARTSFALAAHSLALETGARRNFGEVALRRALGPLLGETSLAVDASGGRALRAQALAQLGRTNVALETIWAGGGFQSDRVLRNISGLHSLTLDHFFGSGPDSIPVQLDARLATRIDGSSALDVRTRASARVGPLSLTGNLGWRGERRPYGPDPPSVVEAGLLANARLGKVRLRGEARWRLSAGARFESATLVGEWNAGAALLHPAQWRAELGYDQLLGRARAGLGYIRRFDRLAVSANGEVASDGSLAAGLSIAFSLGVDPRTGGGLRVTSGKLAQQGATLVRVWRDSNSNGRRDPGEPLQKGVQVSAGRIPVDALTDANGEVIVDGLEPFQPVLVGIDGSSLPDPFVQPATSGLVVTPRPGVAATIELPLVGTGDVDGTLVRRGGGALGGVDLELVDAEGRIASRTRSEFDGFFVFERVPYGRYALRVARLAAEASQLEPTLGRVAQVTATTPSIKLGAVPVDGAIGRQAAR